MVAGHQPLDWGRRADALAHAFGARSCRATARPGRPGYVELAVGRRDPLAQVVPALPIAETVDLDAAPWCPDLGRQRASGVPVATAIVTRPA